MRLEADENHAVPKAAIEDEMARLHCEEENAMSMIGRAWSTISSHLLRERGRWVRPRESRNVNEAEHLPLGATRVLQLDRSIYKCVHKLPYMTDVEGPDALFDGDEQYFLMRVLVGDNALFIEAFHVETGQEVPVVASLTARHEMMRTYQGLGKEERYINLQVQFAAFSLVDVDEGGARYAVIQMA